MDAVALAFDPGRKGEPIFRTSFSSKPARVYPLRIELTPDARPVRVKLRNYSADQRAFLAKARRRSVCSRVDLPESHISVGIRAATGPEAGAFTLAVYGGPSPRESVYNSRSKPYANF